MSPSKNNSSYPPHVAIAVPATVQPKPRLHDRLTAILWRSPTVESGEMKHVSSCPFRSLTSNRISCFAATPPATAPLPFCAMTRSLCQRQVQGSRQFSRHIPTGKHCFPLRQRSRPEYGNSAVLLVTPTVTVRTHCCPKACYPRRTLTVPSNSSDSLLT